MNKVWTRRIIIIAAVIVIFWLIGLTIKLAGWLLNLLLPVAALIITAAIIFSWSKPQKKSTTQTSDTTKEPLKVSRDTSDKRKE